MSTQVEIATAIISTLRNDPTTASLLPDYKGVPAVFTHVPQKFKDYPYIVLYEASLDGDDNSETLAFDGTLNIHVWSDSRDLAVVGNIQKAVYDALHYADLPLGQYQMIDLQQEFITILRDSDGQTLHGVQRFRILLQEG